MLNSRSIASIAADIAEFEIASLSDALLMLPSSHVATKYLMVRMDKFIGFSNIN